MDEDEWSYKTKRKCWENPEELPISLTEPTKNVQETANLLRDFLKKETLPFKVLGEMEIYYSNRSVDDNLNERWDTAYLIIPVLKRGLLRKPKYDKLNAKHYIKIKLSINNTILGTWQEYEWDNGKVHRWYIKMEQIKTWKGLLDKFNKSIPSLKANSDIVNPSAR